MNDEEILKFDNVPIDIASRYLDTSPQYIRVGLQQNRLPFGSAVQVGGTNKWTYQISPGALVNWKHGKSLKDYFNENREYLKTLLND